MPLLQYKFQPYFPDPDSPNNYQCGSEKYCNPITVGDTVYAQFYQTPCEGNEIEDSDFSELKFGPELITNGDFDTTNLTVWYAGPSPLSPILGLVVNGWTGANPDRVEHVSTYTSSLNQPSIGLIAGLLYRIEIDVERTSGNIIIQLGDGAEANQSNAITATGTYTIDLYHTDTIDDIFQIIPSSDFVGFINSVSVKELIYKKWIPNASWNLNDGTACHVVGTTGDLAQDVTPYIVPNSYIYRWSFTITNRTAGSCTVLVADKTSGPISSNGEFSFWDIPTITGILTIQATSDFDGCISDIQMYKLGVAGTAITAKAINEIGTEYDISTSLSNYEDYVTMAFNFEDYELADGCYNIEVTMPCGLDDYTYTSECIQYNSNGFARTKMVVGWCDQPSFGFEFANSGFKLQQRVELRSIAPVYPKQTSIMKMGTGDARLAYSEIEKYWQVHTTFASETFHDAMAAIISCDHFQIGDTQSSGIEYVAQAEDYSPNWQTDGSYSLATAVINVRVKEKGQVFNRHI